PKGGTSSPLTTDSDEATGGSRSISFDQSRRGSCFANGHHLADAFHAHIAEFWPTFVPR
ncbi:hypothetical protein FRC12_022226, partial [Ceratobasidium sp. 428]